MELCAPRGFPLDPRVSKLGGSTPIEVSLREGWFERNKFRKSARTFLTPTLMFGVRGGAPRLAVCCMARCGQRAHMRRPRSLEICEIHSVNRTLISCSGGSQLTASSGQQTPHKGLRRRPPSSNKPPLAACKRSQRRFRSPTLLSMYEAVRDRAVRPRRRPN